MTDLKWDKKAAEARTMGDPELLNQLLGLLLESAKENQALIDQALEREDAKGVMEAGHSLKGAAANMAMENLRATAFEIEQAGRAGDLERARELMPRLDELIDLLAEIAPASKSSPA